MTATATTSGISTARVRSILDSLVRERQRLRNSGTDPSLLEANRQAIVYWQQQLTSTVAASKPGPQET